MSPTMTERAHENSNDDKTKTQIRIDLNAALAKPELQEPISPEDPDTKTQ